MATKTVMPRERPPLRPDLWTPDAGDQSRIDYAWGLWHSQDNLFLKRDRLIEENIRMLAGQQWAMYSKLMGRFVDISYWFSDRERKWRQRPVFNILLRWFMLTHARLTENPPVIAFLWGAVEFGFEMVLETGRVAALGQESLRDLYGFDENTL